MDGDSIVNATEGALVLRNSEGWEHSYFLYRNDYHTAQAFEVLQSFQKDQILCDVKLQTDDGTVLQAHKAVLASASQYFKLMFTSAFKEKNKDHIILHELNSSTLRLLVDFIYTAQIIINEENVQVLLSAANFLQIHSVRDACCEFLQTLLNPTNCLDIMALADLYDCMELLSNSESYTRRNFLEVAKSEKFQSLSFDQVVKFVSSDKLTVPSEDEVLNSIIRWVQYDLYSRKDVFTKLMENIRLPLLSREYLLQKMNFLKSLLKASPINDMIEALISHQSKQFGSFPITMRAKPRQPVSSLKIILVMGGQNYSNDFVEWYDPGTDRWHLRSEISIRNSSVSLAVLKDRRIFAISSDYIRTDTPHNCVEILDLSSPHSRWVSITPMIARRGYLRIAVLDNCIYAVGGYDDVNVNTLNSAEVFDCNTRKWRMISEMSTERMRHSVGVLNYLLYAVGGYNYCQSLNSVECYNPTTNIWTPVANMGSRRVDAGIGILDGVMYAVGGSDEETILKSVEAYRPSDGVWTNVPDMHVCRRKAGVVALEGLLYVLGGDDGLYPLYSVEVYNPRTNTWTMLKTPMHQSRSDFGVVVIDKPRLFK